MAKKILPILLITVLCLLLLAGCGKKKAAEVAEVPAAEKVMEAEVEELPEATEKPETTEKPESTPKPKATLKAEATESPAPEETAAPAEKTDPTPASKHAGSGKQSVWEEDPTPVPVTATPIPTAVPTAEPTATPEPVIVDDSDQPIIFTPVMEIDDDIE